MHPNKAIRHAVVQILRDANIQITTPQSVTVVTVLQEPPRDAYVNDDSLPGIYVFARQERIDPQTHTSDQRTVMFDAVVQANGAQDNAMDQVDDMQLAVEVALMADPTLGGIVMQTRPTGSEIYTTQGEVVFASRRVSFEAKLSRSRTNPAT